MRSRHFFERRQECLSALGSFFILLLLLGPGASFAQIPALLWSVTPVGAGGEHSIFGSYYFQGYPAFMWERKALHVDQNGNAYVAGSVDNATYGMHLFTVKYDPSGNELWRAETSGTARDGATALTVDPSGNVYVLGIQGFVNTAGSAILLIKYDANGQEVWRVSSSLSDFPLALLLDGTGNVLVTGNRPAGGVTVFKFSSAGDLAWHADVPGPLIDPVISTKEQPKGLGVDGGGNLYVLANATGSGYATLKFSPQGVEQWRVPVFEAIPNLQGYRLLALAVDVNGNAHVVGNVGVVDAQDFLIVKYDASGNQLWRRTTNVQSGEYRTGQTIALDAVGNVYVTGGGRQSLSSTDDYITVKLDSAGNEKWRAFADGGGALPDITTAVVVDASQNVYVTGFSTSIDFAESAALTIKYNSTGAEQWRALLGTSPNASFRGLAIGLDGAQNVYVAGNRHPANQFPDAIKLVKYSQTGATVPNAPKITSAQIANGDVQLQFVPPVSNGGWPIFQYVARCGGQLSASGTASPLTVTGLGLGVTYSCTVSATNAIGTGPASVPAIIAWTTPPSAPVQVAATAGDLQAHIAFAAPASAGGAPILNYIATCNPGAVSATGVASPITVSGLANDQLYSCGVIASNSAGSGPSSVTADVTPAAAAPLVLIGAESRKLHGQAGTFAIPIDVNQAITGAVTTEPRMSGALNIAFRFIRAINVPGTVSAVDGAGNPLNAIIGSYAANEISVQLTGLADQSRLTISLDGVNGTLAASVSMGLLAGDVNNSRAVNAGDISSVKANQGKPVTQANFMFDLDASGAITGADVSAAKARAGMVLP